jgi:hypothetical protein
VRKRHRGAISTILFFFSHSGALLAVNVFSCAYFSVKTFNVEQTNDRQQGLSVDSASNVPNKGIFKLEWDK